MDGLSHKPESDGNLASVFTLHFILYYLTVRPRSADLHLLMRPRRLWKCLSTQFLIENCPSVLEIKVDCHVFSLLSVYSPYHVFGIWFKETVGIRFIEKHGTHLYTHCLWGSCKGNFITCKGIFLLCVNNALSEKNTSFRSLFCMQHWTCSSKIFYCCIYCIPTWCCWRGSFLKKISTATFSWPMLCKKYCKWKLFFQLNNLTRELAPSSWLPCFIRDG
jgi:hypothetical protein